MTFQEKVAAMCLLLIVKIVEPWSWRSDTDKANNLLNELINFIYNGDKEKKV
jgi:hypothetical protein